MKKHITLKPLTDKQRSFAKKWVDNYYAKQAQTNTEVAIAAGYAKESAYQRAYELLNPKICPHVVKYIGELKEDWRVKNQIDPDRHMSRLNHLGQKAEEKDMIGVSLRAEELRGKVAGYYIDRQIIKQKGVEDLSREELEERMQQILDDYSHITSHNTKEITNGKTKPKRNG